MKYLKTFDNFIQNFKKVETLTAVNNHLKKITKFGWYKNYFVFEPVELETEEDALDLITIITEQSTISKYRLGSYLENLERHKHSVTSKVILKFLNKTTIAEFITAYNLWFSKKYPEKSEAKKFGF